MSDTDNKTKNTVDTEAADIAPYMKKTGQGKNNKKQEKTEMLIPAILLLISAVVIGATFYNKENNDPLAQTNTPVIAASNVEAIVETPATEVTATQDLSTLNPETTKENTAQTKTNEHNAVAETTTPTVTVEPAVLSTKKVAVSTTAQTIVLTNNALATRAAHPRYKYKQPYSREQAQARTKQHMEMLQQRRQAYEREMQDRRARYETAMKARQEKQTKVSEAKKAVFQRIQKDRLAAEQRIQEIHQQISKLHEEIHQIMHESRKNGAPVQMHSM